MSASCGISTAATLFTAGFGARAIGHPLVTEKAKYSGLPKALVMSEDNEDFCAQQGVPLPTVCAMDDDRDEWEVCGTGVFNCGVPVIWVPKGLEEVDEHAFNFFLKRKVQHVKSGDSFYASSCNFLTGLSSTVLSFFYPGWACLATGGSACIAVGTKRAVDRRADAYAIRTASTEELKGALRYLYARKLNAIQLTDPSCYIGCAAAMKACYKAIMAHDSDYNRIRRVVHELRERGVRVLNVAESYRGEDEDRDVAESQDKEETRILIQSEDYDMASENEQAKVRKIARLLLVYQDRDVSRLETATRMASGYEMYCCYC